MSSETIAASGGRRRGRIGAPGDLVDGVQFTGSSARQTGHGPQRRGGLVESVQPGGPAERAGIMPGDRITAVNGNRIRDVVDYQFHAASALVDLDLISASGNTKSVAILSDEIQPLGITFAQPTFSPIRECNNHCPFCFIDQLPGEMRTSLYIRDDDYRYSFLFGNFVTLTNLNESDWKRLAEQRLSPLYVSVHATDQRLRRLLLGNDRAPDVMVQLRRLFDLGIEVHTQVVVCPPYNDGAALAQTVGDLAGEYPRVRSIGVVPVGLTRTPEEILAGPGASCSRILPSAAELGLRTVTAEEARRVVEQVDAWQQRFRAEYGVSLVHASDEFYLLAGSPMPPARIYDGYPQYENGIGMVRDLLDDWAKERRRLMASPPPPAIRARSLTAVSGHMIAPTLTPMLIEWSAITGIQADLVPLTNSFFGPRVTVSGLLTARDVIANRSRLRGDVVVLPEVMLDKTGSRLLDGVTPAELETRLGKRVRFAGMMSGLAEAATGMRDAA